MTQSELDLNKIDRRIVERLVKKGQLTDKDYERHLKSLPDLTDEAEPIATELESVTLGPSR